MQRICNGLETASKMFSRRTDLNIATRRLIDWSLPSKASRASLALSPQRFNISSLAFSVTSGVGKMWLMVAVNDVVINGQPPAIGLFAL